MNLLSSAIVTIGAVAAVVAAPVPAAQVRPQSLASIDSVELLAFVDSFMTARLASERIPGAGFVFVKNGRALVTRGYGLANVAAQRRVVPEATIWRVGSISKVFTATAVMQLVDRGAVMLDAPVDRYVRRVAMPSGYPDPITVRHLLNHTAGFDEIRPGTQANTREGVLALPQRAACAQPASGAHHCLRYVRHHARWRADRGSVGSVVRRLRAAQHLGAARHEAILH